MNARDRILSAALCLSLAAATLNAEETKSLTLEKISNHGAIYVGYNETAVPFSYVDANGKAIGYSLDLCRHIIDAVKAHSNLPTLVVVPVPVRAGFAQMMVEAGTVDLYCASVTNTQQRQRSVAFSVTTFAAGIKALVRKDSGLRAIGDMQGGVVVSAAGTTSELYLKAAVARRSVALNYRLARDQDDALHQVLDGSAKAMVEGDVLLHGLLMNAPDADAGKLVVLDENFAVEPYALMFRRNDPELKTLVDETLIGLMKSGEFGRLYTRWFTLPIPPKGKNLNLPMNDLLKQLILTPNDKGI
jgi:glutamate/aspartate transport system substrate-binding protein